MTALLLAAGLIGYARVGAGLLRRFHTRSVAVALVVLPLAGLIAATAVLQIRFARVPEPISLMEADRLWYWIRQVGPEEGVLAAYETGRTGGKGKQGRRRPARGGRR